MNKRDGATGPAIRQQFVFEAIIISVMGGLLGVFLGMMLGNLMPLLLGSAFVVPWLVDLHGHRAVRDGGAYFRDISPPIKASKLDPIVGFCGIEIKFSVEPV